MTKRKYLIVAAVAILAGAYFNQEQPTAADSLAAVASAAVAAVAAYKVNRIILEEEKNK